MEVSDEPESFPTPQSGFVVTHFLVAPPVTWAPTSAPTSERIFGGPVKVARPRRRPDGGRPGADGDRPTGTPSGLNTRSGRARGLRRQPSAPGRISGKTRRSPGTSRGPRPAPCQGCTAASFSAWLAADWPGTQAISEGFLAKSCPISWPTSSTCFVRARAAAARAVAAPGNVSSPGCRLCLDLQRFPEPAACLLRLSYHRLLCLGQRDAGPGPGGRGRLHLGHRSRLHALANACATAVVRLDRWLLGFLGWGYQQRQAGCSLRPVVRVDCRPGQRPVLSAGLAPQLSRLSRRLGLRLSGT